MSQLPVAGHQREFTGLTPFKTDLLEEGRRDSNMLGAKLRKLTQPGTDQFKNITVRGFIPVYWPETHQ